MKTVLGFCGKLGSGKGYHMLKTVEDLKSNGYSIFMVSFADPIKQILRDSFGLQKTGKMNTKLPDLSELYVKYQVVDKLYELVKNLDCEKFKGVSEKDLKSYILYNYENYEKEFYTHIKKAVDGKWHPEYDRKDFSDYPYHFRRLGQMLGTELGRNLIDTIWVDTAFNKIKNVFRNNLADFATIDDVRFVNEFKALEEFRTKTIFSSKIYGIVTTDDVRAERRGMLLEELKKQDEHSSEKEIDEIINLIPKENIIINN